MTQIVWDNTGERTYETGVDRGVLYIPDNTGAYTLGVGWNGLTTVTESPSGADASPQYADNIKYLNLIAAEEFGGTIEAFTYPKEFAQFDGSISPYAGVSFGQQTRKSFGFSFRTKKGNDLLGNDYGYIIHLVYGALAAPSEKAYATVNDSPEALAFSWDFSTTGVSTTAVDPATSKTLKNSAILKVDSTLVTGANLLALETILYGAAGVAPRLPLPDEVFALFAGAVTTVVATQPTFVAATGVITIPTITGVQYRRADTNQNVANGSTVTIAASGQSLVIKAVPLAGYILGPTSDDDWSFTRT